MGVEDWFEFMGVSNNRGFEESGKANPKEMTTGSSYQEVQETN